MIGIYKITNNVTNKSYIGQSINIEKRWYEHKYKAECVEDRSYNSILHNSMRKYGIEHFILEVLEECTIEELDTKEQFWIQQLNTISPYGYNILQGGQGSRKRKVSYCLRCGKEVYRTSTFCANCLGASNQTVKRPEPIELARLVKVYGFNEVGRQYGVSGNSIKKWCKAYKMPYHKQELIDWYNKEANIIIPKKLPYKRSVQQLDKDTNEILQIFNSSMDAARALGKSSGSHITEACQGKLNQAYGYKWKYNDTD